MNANRPEMTKPEGNGALEFYINVATKETEMILNSLPQNSGEDRSRSQVEAPIIDPVQFFVELGPMRLGIPYIDVATAVYFDYFGHTPFCVYDWPHETTPEARVRNQAVMSARSVLRPRNRPFFAC
jgi:zeaxanthin glucosyltransferase